MLKEQIIEYRNAHKEARVLLGTVLGELDRVDKNPTDAQCVTVIKKLIEGNIECGLLDENKILDLFLPKQLDGMQIRQIIADCKFSDLGSCMKHFKTNYAGLYNGSWVSQSYNIMKPLFEDVNIS